MPILFIYFIGLSTIIASVINFVKPAYKKLAGKFNATISIALSFILGILAAFSVAPYLTIELNNGLLIILWLALGTGSNLFYDLWNIIKSLGDKIKASIEE